MVAGLVWAVLSCALVALGVDRHSPGLAFFGVALVWVHIHAEQYLKDRSKE